MNSTLEGIIQFAAPSLGALLLGLIAVQGVLALDIATALLAILPLFFVRVPQPAARGDGEGAARRVQDLGAGLRYIWNWRGLRLFVATTLLTGLVSQPLFSFLPLLVTEHFQGGALQLGWLGSAMGLGWWRAACC